MKSEFYFSDGQAMKHAYPLTNIAVQNLLLFCFFAGSDATAFDTAVVRFERRPALLRSHCAGYCFVSDVQPWLAKCEQKIRQAGFIEKDFARKTIKMQIIFSAVPQSDSVIGTLTLVQSSGSKVTDNAALHLVQTAAPFDLPECESPINRQMLIEMDYPRLELKFAPKKKDRDYLPWKIDPYVPDSRPRPLKPWRYK